MAIAGFLIQISQRNIATTARLIDDGNRHIKQALTFDDFLNQPRCDVGAATRRRLHDQFDRLARFPAFLSLSDRLSANDQRTCRKS